MEHFTDAREYSFFQLNSLLDRACSERSLSDGPQSVVRYRAQPSLSFPATDVVQCQWCTSSGNEFLELMVSFMGLFGPASPLPAYYTERVIQSDDPHCPSRDFMDMFNHRAIQLLQVCWEKYRYYRQYKAGGSDQFTQWLLSIAGVDASHLPKQHSLRWQKLLPLVGLISQNRCSPNTLQKVISNYFHLNTVQVEPWIKRTVRLLPDQYNAMGQANAVMGRDMVLGDELADCSGKFSLHLKQLSLSQYKAFLPGEPCFSELIQLVQLIQNVPLDYDLCLHLESGSEFTDNNKPLQQMQMGWCARLGEALEPVVSRICVTDYVKFL